MIDERKDLLIKIKKSRLAGYKPKKDEEGLCIDLHKQEFIGRERVLSAGKSPDDQDKIFYRFYIKPKGNRYVGTYGTSVDQILYRGGSCPVGFDRHGRACNHEAGVFLSPSKDIAMYFATRFSEHSPIIEECMIATHDLYHMDGKGWTSPELRLNEARKRYISNYDAIKVTGMHMGHLDQHDGRYLTEEHKQYNVPELSDIYIVFNVWDIYTLTEHETKAASKPPPTIVEDETDLLKSISLPRINHGQ